MAYKLFFVDLACRSNFVNLHRCFPHLQVKHLHSPKFKSALESELINNDDKDYKIDYDDYDDQVFSWDLLNVSKAHKHHENVR